MAVITYLKLSVDDMTTGLVLGPTPIRKIIQYTESN
jgi:hypothetical protein